MLNQIIESKCNDNSVGASRLENSAILVGINKMLGPLRTCWKVVFSNGSQGGGDKANLGKLLPLFVVSQKYYLQKFAKVCQKCPRNFVNILFIKYLRNL